MIRCFLDGTYRAPVAWEWLSAGIINIIEGQFHSTSEILWKDENT